jgi:hypothetical protein
MGGRYTRLTAEAGIKRAAVYVVQTGNGATPSFLLSASGSRANKGLTAESAWRISGTWER